MQTFNLSNLIPYCERHSSPHSQLLWELERETHLKTLAPQMLSGHLQGRMLSLLSRLKKPRYILEIGTFTGYASLCMAEGLTSDGKLITIEANPELAWFIKKYKQKAGLENQIIDLTGRAEDLVPTIDYKYDMVFMDAGKRDYEAHYNLIIDKVNPGALIFADNVLWSGKVLQDPAQYDIDTQILHAFNQKIQADERVENLLLPIRDGLMMMIRK